MKVIICGEYLNSFKKKSSKGNDISYHRFLVDNEILVCADFRSVKSDLVDRQSYTLGCTIRLFNGRNYFTLNEIIK